MSVSATVETRSRTNVLAVPIASVTTRSLKDSATNSPASNAPAGQAQATNPVSAKAVTMASSTNEIKEGRKANENAKPVDVVFVVNGDQVKTVPVKIGISDDNYWEITDGLKEGDEIVTGSFHAISRDLDDGKKIVKSSGVADIATSQP